MSAEWRPPVFDLERNKAIWAEHRRVRKEAALRLQIENDEAEATRLVEARAPLPPGASRALKQLYRAKLKVADRAERDRLRVEEREKRRAAARQVFEDGIPRCRAPVASERGMCGSKYVCAMPDGTYTCQRHDPSKPPPKKPGWKVLKEEVEARQRGEDVPLPMELGEGREEERGEDSEDSVHAGSWIDEDEGMDETSDDDDDDASRFRIVTEE